MSALQLAKVYFYIDVNVQHLLLLSYFNIFPEVTTQHIFITRSV